MNIGYIGLGAMGSALAARLQLSRDLTVFDLNPEAVERLCALGAKPAPSARALAQGCDVIFLCLPKSEHVAQAIFGAQGVLEGAREGLILIDQTSGDPAVTRRMAQDLVPRGITLVDAPVSGGPKGAAAGTIAIMTGGSPEVLDHLAPIFAAISPNVQRCGETGAGQVMKLVNNMISTCNRIALLEGAALGIANGLDLSVITEVINTGGARSKSSETMLRALAEGLPKATFALDLMLKDLNLACGLGLQSGAPIAFGQAARAVLQVASHHLGKGAGIDDIADLIAHQAGISFTSTPQN